MTSDQRFTLILAGLSLLFAVMCTMLGMIYKNGKRAGEANVQIKFMAESITKIGDNLDKHINWHLNKGK
jgi:hypothetical protein